MVNLKIKKLLVIYAVLFFTAPFLYAQQTAINVNAWSGVSFFRGDGAAKNSTMTSASFFSPAVTVTNPYGKQAGFSYAVELEVQRLTKTKFIYGAGLGFEALTTKVNIDSVYVEPEVIVFPNHTMYPSNGKVLQHNSFITLHPFAGRRLVCHKISVDIIAGVDLGFCLHSNEKGGATYTVSNNANQLTVNQELARPSIDVRPGVQIKTRYNKWGLAAGYAAGLTNFKAYGNGKAYTNVVKLGMSYQLR